MSLNLTSPRNVIEIIDSDDDNENAASHSHVDLEEEGFKAPSPSRRLSVRAISDVNSTNGGDDLGENKESMTLMSHHSSDMEVLTSVLKPRTEELKEKRSLMESNREIQVAGNSTQTKLSHMRQHCTERVFVEDVVTNDTFSTLTRKLNWELNQLCCDKCYCYICNVPVKECKRWKSDKFGKRVQVDENHCLASDKGADADIWTSLRLSVGSHEARKREAEASASHDSSSVPENVDSPSFSQTKSAKDKSVPPTHARSARNHSAGGDDRGGSNENNSSREAGVSTGTPKPPMEALKKKGSFTDSNENDAIRKAVLEEEGHKTPPLSRRLSVLAIYDDDDSSTDADHDENKENISLQSDDSSNVQVMTCIPKPRMEAFKDKRALKASNEEIQVLGVRNRTKLPHMRQHCTENLFVQDAICCRNPNEPSVLKEILNWELNQLYCDKCYCYVCDVPVKECKRWKSDNELNNEAHEANENHCLASDKGADAKHWKALRMRVKSEMARKHEAMAKLEDADGASDSISEE